MLTALKAWIWLSRHLDAGRIRQALQQFETPERCYFADAAEYSEALHLTDNARKKLADKSLEETEEILAACDAAGIRLLTLQDADYPERLRNIDSPPAVLYYRGTLPRFDEEIAIAVAGTRRASPYGRKAAGELGFQITRLGGLVLTGIVDGCDFHAADGALKAGGPVVCVLAGGVDVPYYDSEANRRLLSDVTACGALISEYPPGTPYLPDHFLQRNRILTGLALGVVCIEAPLRSGTLMVARLSAEQGRDVYAIPANIDAPAGEGTNQLLSRGEALCVCSGADVLSHYWGLYPRRRRTPDPAVPQPEPVPSEVRQSEHLRKPKNHPPAPAAEAPAPAAPARPTLRLEQRRQEFTEDEITLLRALQAAPMVSDLLTAETGLSARTVSSVLTVLTIRGLVRQLPGSRFEATVELI